MANRGLTWRPPGRCFGGIGNARTLGRTAAATRLGLGVAAKRSKPCGLMGFTTARLRPTTAGDGVLCCGRLSLRRFSQMPLRCASAERADREKEPSAEGIRAPEGRPSRVRKLAIGAVISLGAVLLYTLIPDDNPGRSKSSSALNDETFRKFTVVSNEQISPTSFILTVKPPASSDDRESAEVIRKAWEHGLWSVEIKQPQLQIARHYTPLPPPLHVQDGDGATLRFLVRRYDGGEVSKYLSRLRGGGPSGAGDVVELRGPHLGFDVAARLGEAGRNVVFLAGGTGIAPALQVARRALSVPGGEGLSVRVYWANRSALDCAGCPRLEGQKRRSWWSWSTGGRGQHVNEELGAPGPIVQQLRDLEAAYRQKGSTLDFRCVVDEEGSRISAGDIMVAVSSLTARKDTGQTADSGQASSSSSSCYLHSQRLLQNSTEDADAQESKDAQVTGGRRCNCSGDGATGRNLFMISGPDGFVNAYVGPKVWAAGAERQGPLGGVVGELRKKNPRPWVNWLVLKQ